MSEPTDQTELSPESHNIKRKGRDLTEGDIGRHLCDLAGPMVIGISALILVGMTDTYFAKFLGTQAQAALGVVTPIAMVANSLILGAAGGASSLLSRTIGAGRPNKAKAIARDMLIFLLLAAVIVAAPAFLFRAPLLQILGAESELAQEALPYLQIYFFTFPLIASAMVTSGILRTYGERFLPAAMLMLASIVNIILDPILMFGLGPFPRLELAGLALASAIAWSVSLFVGLFVAILRRGYIAIDGSRIGSVAQSARDIAQLAAPASLANALGPVGAMLAVSAVLLSGEAAVAGYGIGARIEALISIPFFALTSALSPVNGQNAGAMHFHRVRTAFFSTYRMCLIWGMASALLLLIFAPFLTALFTQDPEAIKAGTLYLRINCLAFFGAGIAMNAAAGFNGVGEPVRGMLITFARSILLTGPFAWLGALQFGLVGAFIGIAAANLLAGLWALWATHQAMQKMELRARARIAAQKMGTKEVAK